MISPKRLALMTSVKNQSYALMEKHGLIGWRVEFDGSLHRAGTCRYEEKQIIYSIFFFEVADQELRNNTILHEISHAIAGPEAAHGEIWRRIHVSLGGNGLIKTPMPAALSTHDYFLWIGTCPTCGYRTGLEEEPDSPFLCGNCPKTTDEFQRLFQWSRDGELISHDTMTSTYVEEYNAAKERFKIK